MKIKKSTGIFNFIIIYAVISIKRHPVQEQRICISCKIFLKVKHNCNNKKEKHCKCKHVHIKKFIDKTREVSKKVFYQENLGSAFPISGQITHTMGIIITVLRPKI